MEEKRYEEFYSDGTLKESCPLNKWGELDGWCIKFNPDGTEAEKVFYDNGILIGNPFTGKSPEEIVDMLGGTIEEDFINEEGEEEYIVTPKFASTLLNGDEFYGRKKNNNTTEKKNKFAETRENFVNAVIESLEKGKIPWQKTWDTDCGNNLLYNPVTGTKYKGVNNIMLIYSSYAKGYEDNRWVTFNQAKEKGWSVRKGEKGTPIEVFKFYDKSTKKDLDMTMYNSLNPAEKVEYFTKNVYIVAKNYTVFNAQQVEGIPPVEKKEVKNIDYNKIDKIIENCGVPITHKGSSAFYSPSTDQIFLPEREAFHSENDYYATALHEIAHSTGHPSRLNRDLSGKFGSKSYATEELKAEFASVFIGQEKGLNYNFENNIAYIQSWAEVIKNNHEVLFSAIKEASKISEMVLGYEKGKMLSKELTKGKDKGNEIEI